VVRLRNGRCHERRRETSPALIGPGTSRWCWWAR